MIEALLLAVVPVLLVVPVESHEDKTLSNAAESYQKLASNIT